MIDTLLKYCNIFYKSTNLGYKICNFLNDKDKPKKNKLKYYYKNVKSVIINYE